MARGWLAVTATGAALLLLAGPAAADLGDLTPKGCIRWSGSPDFCLTEVEGLAAPESVAVSSDGASVYVAGRFDDAIVMFDRSTKTGRLAPLGCVEDNDSGLGSCAQSIDGLDQAASVSVSPDGKSVYAASAGDNAIAVFKRDKQTGELTPQGCIEDNDTGPDACAQSTDGLAGAVQVAVSADNKSVYVASFFDEAVVRFTRNTTTGALTPAGCVDDNDTGADACFASTDGLNGARAVTISPDGKSVYAGSFGDSAVVRFNRNTSTGALTAGGCVDDDTGPDLCAQSMTVLETVTSLAISPDGKSLYATGFADDAVNRLKRDTASGALTPRGCITSANLFVTGCTARFAGLSESISVAVSGDGNSVYVTSFYNGGAITSFERTTSGALAVTGCIDDNDNAAAACDPRTDGLAEAHSVVVSPDGKSVYVAGRMDSAIVRFKRQTVAD